MEIRKTTAYEEIKEEKTSFRNILFLLRIPKSFQCT